MITRTPSGLAVHLTTVDTGSRQDHGTGSPPAPAGPEHCSTPDRPSGVTPSLGVAVLVAVLVALAAVLVADRADAQPVDSTTPTPIACPEGGPCVDWAPEGPQAITEPATAPSTPADRIGRQGGTEGPLPATGGTSTLILVAVAVWVAATGCLLVAGARACRRRSTTG